MREIGRRRAGFERGSSSDIRGPRSPRQSRGTPITRRTIILWDIDYTLLYTRGAGRIAMSRAFEELYGVPNAFGQVEVSGRSDTAIFLEAARVHAVADPRAAMDDFVDAYALKMDVALKETAGSLMPGVEAALVALEGREDVTQGLGTGNFRRTSEAKLRHYGIDGFFPECIGGFGDDHEQREELIRIGINRLCDRRNGDRIVIVGDTPHDVAAARANNAFCLAVGTGKDSVEELMAAGADNALKDLSDTPRVIDILLGTIA